MRYIVQRYSRYQSMKKHTLHLLLGLTLLVTSLAPCVSIQSDLGHENIHHATSTDCNKQDTSPAPCHALMAATQEYVAVTKSETISTGVDAIANTYQVNPPYSYWQDIAVSHHKSEQMTLPLLPLHLPSTVMLL